ncbi:MAG: UDP-forming cellulose synthase catalytic subunit [Herminiimonas sp.]|nr:UDP-forming cellulose synthase catalytic subunit [Herminiimonas sp.]
MLALFAMIAPYGVVPASAGQARAQLFPQVDFTRLRPADLLRIPLQLLWLALIRPQPPEAPGLLMASLQRLQQWADSLLYLLRQIAGGLQRAAQAMAGHLLPQQTLVALRRARSDILAAPRIGAFAEQLAAQETWRQPLVQFAALLLALVLVVLCITTPFDVGGQILFLACLWLVAMLVRRVPGQLPVLMLIVLSVTASTRYLWWRVTTTLNWDQPFDLTWGLGLVAAEIYVWIVLLLGYVQSAWPLKRVPVALPADPRDWPSVDVFIPTYNEPLSVVKPTVFAAMGIDWPADKLHIYLLDDGRRDEFRDFAAEVGINYVIRPDNLHAKAGNLNHALARTGSEFVAIFDCDHIPTRAFLQATMGWFIGDPKMALLQTPHHFFSPDPFEKNLGVFRNMPNEGELFYGVVQDGNDLWNATFFCGSCAVIRRTPLVEVGGIAVETVTEDAHTALKMQRLGYKSAYLNVPLAAGLATESLSAHIGQRIRWARGMAQIFRLDNPFLGKGLSWAQRACYGNSMMHFFNGGPRLVFLTAPLAFLIFHAYVIYAPAIMVLLFVVPHMVHASLANSRIQGKHRHSFWAEVYETVLAWYIVRPTTVALLNPHKGKFNVTAKGGLVERRYFDWDITTPYVITVALNLIGVGFGVWRLTTGAGEETSTTWLNLIWTVYNLLILGAAISVALEAKQQRRSHRVQIALPALLHLPDGNLVRCETVDFSEGGASLAITPHRGEAVPIDAALLAETAVSVSLWRGDDEHQFPALVTAVGGANVRVRWNLANRAQEMALVQCTFSRADAWVTWADGRQVDRPLRGLLEVLWVGLSGYRRMIDYAPASLTPAIAALRRAVKALASVLPRHPAIDPSARPSL